MLDQMKDAKFSDILTAPDGTTESGKDFGDSTRRAERCRVILIISRR